jgi:phosphoserine phosphatase
MARHGQTLWNADRRFQGATDVGLSELGRRQAHALGLVLRGQQPSRVYASPLRRAVETAEIALAAAGGAPLTILPDLTELSLGDWEGCTVDEIRRRDGDPYQQWLRAPLDCTPPGAEPLPDVCTRVCRAVDHIAATHQDNGDVLVIAHGGVISVYACHLLGLSFNSLWRLRVDNASVTTFAPPQIISLNDTTHLRDVHGHGEAERVGELPTR